jgi:PIN domain nuclease of toxin-antitoxin system
VRLLLDTQIAIWAVSATRALPARARELMQSGSAELLVSTISIFEIATKHSLGKASAPPFSGRVAARLFTEAGFELLPVLPEHASAVDELPWLHRDPFDRLLVAQALAEPLRFLTADRQLAPYSDFVIPC